jgi:non-heme chloroperoxidase
MPIPKEAGTLAMPWEQSYGYAQAVRVGDTIWVSGQLFYKDLAVLFYGANRQGANVSQGILEQFWLWSMQAGLKNAYESIKAFSETDQTEDLKKFDVPTLVLHGEDDQIVPVKDSAKKSARLIKGAKEIYYPGAPHGLTATHQDQVNRDLLVFLRS